jgi:hypothetical protein
MSALCALMFVDISVITKIAGLCPLLFCCGYFLIRVALVLSVAERIYTERRRMCGIERQKLLFPTEYTKKKASKPQWLMLFL